MKVLYIAHTSDNEGSSVALINIAKGMQGRDIEFAVVCPDSKGALVASLHAMGVRVFVPRFQYTGFYVYPLTKNPLLWLKRMLGVALREVYGRWYLPKVVKAFHPDIIHTNSGACSLGWKTARSMHIPHVWHIREYMDKDFGLTVIPSNRTYRERLHSIGNYNITITQSIFQHFNLRPVDECIYDGVIDSHRAVGDTPAFGYPYFLFVGNIIKAKGVDTLVEQFLSFHKSDDRRHLVLAGPYDREPELYDSLQKKIAAADAADYVHWLGRRSDVYELMRGATALIVPSYNEGFGFITAEAMFCRCLVIGRDTAGTKEQFDKGKDESGGEIGLRFSSDSEMPSLMHLAATSNFDEIKKRALEVVLNNYTIEANTQRIYKFYENVLSQH